MSSPLRLNEQPPLWQVLGQGKLDLPSMGGTLGFMSSATTTTQSYAGLVISATSHVAVSASSVQQYRTGNEPLRFH